jgi:hypothetical protein
MNLELQIQILRRKINMKNNKHYAYHSPFKMVDSEGIEYTLKVETDDCAENPREWDNVCTMVCFHRRYDLGDKHTYDDSDEFFDDILHNICGLEYEDFEELSTIEKYRLACESDKIYIKELNLYDHSGLTISTSSCYPYNDRWDAGCVGWVYVSKEKAMYEWGGIPEKDENGEFIKITHEHPNGNVTYSIKCTPITDENWQDCADYHIEGEVKTYDEYLRGDVYGFVLTKKVIEQEKCPHCGEVIREWEDEDDIDSCWGFYGDCLEDNGILDNLGKDLKFKEE